MQLGWSEDGSSNSTFSRQPLSVKLKILMEVLLAHFLQNTWKRYEIIEKPIYKDRASCHVCHSGDILLTGFLSGARSVKRTNLLPPKLWGATTENFDATSRPSLVWISPCKTIVLPVSRLTQGHVCLSTVVFRGSGVSTQNISSSVQCPGHLVRTFGSKINKHAHVQDLLSEFAAMFEFCPNFVKMTFDIWMSGTRWANFLFVMQAVGEFACFVPVCPDTSQSCTCVSSARVYHSKKSTKGFRSLHKAVWTTTGQRELESVSTSKPWAKLGTTSIWKAGKTVFEFFLPVRIITNKTPSQTRDAWGQFYHSVRAVLDCGDSRAPRTDSFTAFCVKENSKPEKDTATMFTFGHCSQVFITHFPMISTEPSLRPRTLFIFAFFHWFYLQEKGKYRHVDVSWILWTAITTSVVPLGSSNWIRSWLTLDTDFCSQAQNLALDIWKIHNRSTWVCNMWKETMGETTHLEIWLENLSRIAPRSSTAWRASCNTWTLPGVLPWSCRLDWIRGKPHSCWRCMYISTCVLSSAKSESGAVCPPCVRLQLADDPPTNVNK